MSEEEIKKMKKFYIIRFLFVTGIFMFPFILTGILYKIMGVV